MTDLVVIFLLGPFFFFPRLLTFSVGSLSELYTFIASGLGTAFWSLVLGAIGGVAK